MKKGKNRQPKNGRNIHSKGRRYNILDGPQQCLRRPGDHNKGKLVQIIVGVPGQDHATQLFIIESVINHGNACWLHGWKDRVFFIMESWNDGSERTGYKKRNWLENEILLV